MKNHKKPIQFRNEDEEFKFWAKADSTAYVYRSKIVKGRFPNLKLTSKSIPKEINSVNNA